MNSKPVGFRLPAVYMLILCNVNTNLCTLFYTFFYADFIALLHITSHTVRMDAEQLNPQKTQPRAIMSIAVNTFVAKTCFCRGKIQFIARNSETTRLNKL